MYFQRKVFPMNQPNYNFPLLGVEQSCHGHLYRWIYTEEGWAEFSQGYDNHEFNEDGTKWIDIGCPIGGSNSSATYITKLNSIDEVKGFLLAPYETDLDDPTLADIAEGIYTIDTDDEYCLAITTEFIKLLNIPEKELTKDNSLYEVAADLVAQIKEMDKEETSGIDYENPFYGDSSDMRYSELQNIYVTYYAIEHGFFIEISPHLDYEQKVFADLSERGYQFKANVPLPEFHRTTNYYLHVPSSKNDSLNWQSTKPETQNDISCYEYLSNPDYYYSKIPQTQIMAR